MNPCLFQAFEKVTKIDPKKGHRLKKLAFECLHNDGFLLSWGKATLVVACDDNSFRNWKTGELFRIQPGAMYLAFRRD